MSESQIVRELAEKAARRITRRVISTLQKMKDTLSGDDSELKTTWDEICVQVQGEVSFHWDAYDETVRRIVVDQLRSLSGQEREAIWLQTEAADDWTCKDEEDREPEPPVTVADMVDLLTEAYVYAEAARWSNARIRAYLER